MIKTLILILTFLPFTLLGQQLECCKSVEEVGNNINGIGKFWKFTFNDKNEFTILNLNQKQSD
ncbi:MAG: hypothetical protein ABJK28_14300 [Algibacter sp.]